MMVSTNGLIFLSSNSLSCPNNADCRYHISGVISNTSSYTYNILMHFIDTDGISLFLYLN